MVGVGRRRSPCCDRIVFRGTFRLVANLAGMHQYLSYLGILMKDFKQYAQEKTAELIRVKHEACANSVKIYDKAGSILRTEFTVNNHRAYEPGDGVEAIQLAGSLP